MLIKQHGQGVWASQKGHYGFHMVREPHVPSFLAEHFYYTNFAEWKKCYTQEYIDKCAKVAAKTICAYAGVTYKEPDAKPDPKPDPGTIYRVQVGAFTQKAGADALAKELQSKGYSTIVK
jgi:N-acetylmuramoyl-L-alanine amidase